MPIIPKTHLRVPYLNRGLQLSALTSIQRFGSDDFANDFTAMCSHDQPEGVDNFVDFLQPSVVSHNAEQVSSAFMESYGLGGISQGRGL